MRARSVLLIAGLAVAACGGGGGTVTPDPLAGTYIAASGESAVPLAKALTAQLAAGHPGMTWNVAEVGSGAALALASSGEADVAFVTRELTLEDRMTVAATGLGYMGQVFAVNRANPITGLSTDQLRGIFSGTIRDWAAVGGTPGPIRVFIRPDTSPTRAALDPLLFPSGAKYRADAVFVPEASGMRNAIATAASSIGMLSAPYIGTDAAAPRAIAIDGIVPTRENVASAKYQYRRPVYLVVRGNASLVRPGARALLDLLRTDDGRRVLGEYF